MDFLYMTFHGGVKSGSINTIYKYALDGSLISDSFLDASPHLLELRGMATLADGSLLVVDSFRADTFVAKYGPCDTNGTRQYVGIFADATKSLVHTYGIAVDWYNTTVFETNQDTSSITWQDIDGNPLSSKYGKGVFFLFSNGGSPRGIAVDRNGNIWAAVHYSGGPDALSIIDMQGNAVSTMTDAIDRPIGVFSDGERVYVANDRKKKNGNVLTFDASSTDQILTFTDGSMVHPTAIATYGKTLYVVTQGSNDVPPMLYAFDKTTAELTQKLELDVSDVPEQLIISTC